MKTQPKTSGGTPSGEISIRELPLPISQETFTARGRTYGALRYRIGEGPNLNETKAILKNMPGSRRKMLLTTTEAKEIIASNKLNTAFKEKLQGDEWAFLDDSEAASMRLAAYLMHYSHNGGFLACGYGRPNYVALAVLFKIEEEPNIRELKRG